MQAGHETMEPERSGSMVGFYDCCLFSGQRRFQMNRTGADAILHVKAPFLGLSAEQTSRRFQIVGSDALAEVASAKSERNTDC